jgi:hypothetical protein
MSARATLAIEASGLEVPGAVLLCTGRYPRGIFDFVLGRGAGAERSSRTPPARRSAPRRRPETFWATRPKLRVPQNVVTAVLANDDATFP